MFLLRTWVLYPIYRKPHSMCSTSIICAWRNWSHDFSISRWKRDKAASWQVYLVCEGSPVIGLPREGAFGHSGVTLFCPLSHTLPWGHLQWSELSFYNTAFGRLLPSRFTDGAAMLLASSKTGGHSKSQNHMYVCLDGCLPWSWAGNLTAVHVTWWLIKAFHLIFRRLLAISHAGLNFRSHLVLNLLSWMFCSCLGFVF